MGESTDTARRYFIRLSTGDCGIGVAKRPSARRTGNVFVVRVGKRTEHWPDYDVFECGRLRWWLSRVVGA